jgi:hypothetical protein
VKIFNDHRQAVRFAFLLAGDKEIEGVSRSSLVRVALNEAGTNVPGVLLDAPTLAQIGDYAGLVLATIETALLASERAVLTAHYSTDWEARRTVTSWLQDHYRPQLASQVGNPALADRIVSRHYIAERDRSQYPGWEVASIAAEFNIGIQKLLGAITLLEKLDAQVEAAALSTIEKLAALPTLEAEHA